MNITMYCKPNFSAIMKNNNHEIWRKCENCGAFNDLRKTDECEECKTKLNETR